MEIRIGTSLPNATNFYSENTLCGQYITTGDFDRIHKTTEYKFSSYNWQSLLNVTLTCNDTDLYGRYITIHGFGGSRLGISAVEYQPFASNKIFIILFQKCYGKINSEFSYSKCLHSKSCLDANRNVGVGYS